MNVASIVRLQNPWLDGRLVPLPDHFIPRNGQRVIDTWKDSTRALVLTGPRQSGKSTLIMRWIADGFDQGRFQAHEVLYLNADHLGLREQMEYPETLLDLAKALPRGLPRVLVLDEAQRLQEPGLLVKQLVDLHTGMLIIVSGSSSLVIRSQAREHLTGRQIELLLPPLSYRERVADRLDLSDLVDAPLDRLRERWPLVGSSLLELADDQAVFGGYPAVVRAQDVHDRQQHLFGLYDTYVRRDVVDFLGVHDPGPFNRFVNLLAEQTGGLINKAELSTAAGISAPTTERYLSILADTHVMLQTAPYFANRRKEIVKARKAFFLDGGLRNAALGRLDALASRSDRGALTENLVVSEIWKELPRSMELHYWRTKAGAEVDIVLCQGEDRVAVEVKSGPMQRPPKITRGYRSFIDNYAPRRCFILNRDRFCDSAEGLPTVLPIPVFLLAMPSILRQET